jgi:hypothetical protein
LKKHNIYLALQWNAYNDVSTSESVMHCSRSNIEVKNFWEELGTTTLLQPSNHVPFYILKKGKAVPLQAWGGPEGSRKLRFPYFLTTAEDGGKVVSLTHRPHLPPGNAPGTHFC